LFVMPHVKGSRCTARKNFEAAKKIHVYLNGDTHCAARSFTVPKILEKTQEPLAMQGLQEMLTEKFKYQFPNAVRHIVTPSKGTRIKRISDLENDKHYVACHKRNLIRLDYNSIGDINGQKIPNRGRQIHTTWSVLRRDSQIFSKPREHWNQYAHHYKNSDGVRALYDDKKPRKVVHIYGNGDPVNSIKILLSGRLAENEKETFKQILNLISDRIGATLPCTRSAMAARKLYDLSGNRIKKASQIEDGKSYIVCGDQKLKRLNYGDTEEFQPVWRGTLSPGRTTDGRIKMYEQEITSPKKLNVKLPKVNIKDVKYSARINEIRESSANASSKSTD